MGQLKFVCWHPELGYLRFGSYSTATANKNVPDPRCLFSKESDAIKRTKEPFYCKSIQYAGSDIKIFQVRVHIEVLDT